MNSTLVTSSTCTPNWATTSFVTSTDGIADSSQILTPEGSLCSTTGTVWGEFISTKETTNSFSVQKPSHCCGSGRPCAKSEEHTSELQSLAYLVCRLLLEKKKFAQNMK